MSVELVCRYCGNALVVDGLRLIVATASSDAGRICPNNRHGHDVADDPPRPLGSPAG